MRFLKLALAVYRLTSLFHMEDGPRNVFDWIRYKAGVQVYNVEGQAIRDADGFWGELLNCPWCLSVWFAAGIVILNHLFPKSKLLSLVVDWLAVAGVSRYLFGES